MIIVGAKGLAKEVLEIFQQNNELDGLVFYDDVNKDAEHLLYDQFPILKNDLQVQDHFRNVNSRFIIGIGKPKLRYKLFQKFSKLGGIATSSISLFSHLGSFDVIIGEGTVILSNAIFSNSTTMGLGGLVYYNVIVTHDCLIGDFVELSPGATILGRCKIGDFTHIGSNATILPNLTIGQNVVIGAGSVVTKNIPDNSIAYGNPARIIDKSEFLKL